MINTEYYYSIIDQAFKIFNNCMNTDYSRDNVKILLLEPESADKAIVEFIQDFHEKDEERICEPGYYKTICGEAFVSEKARGIMIRTDLKMHSLEWRSIVFHEISHIYCCEHELDGELFYQKYCIDYAEGIIDNSINAGYAIWREFVADILATSVDVDMEPQSIKKNVKQITNMYSGGKIDIFNAKQFVTNVLDTIFLSREVMEDFCEETIIECLVSIEIINPEVWANLIFKIMEQLSKQEFYKINVDFIAEIGDLYFALMENMARK